MTDPAAPPADPAAPPAADPAAPAAPPQVATRPDWLPESFWDAKANALNTDDFGKHYGELAAAQTKLAEITAKVPTKAEDYKLEVKLPDTVKVPDGMQIKVDEKDPRIPLLRQVAHQHGMTQDAVNALVALDAQMKIETHKADVAFAAEQTKKLGENAPARRDAINNWAKGLADKGDLSTDEFEEIRLAASTAAGVTLFEKLMARLNGNVPGNTPARDPTPAPKSWAERMYPNLPSGLPPAARSA